jgi:hypothetical protein
MESARGGGGGDGRHHLETLALASKEGTDPPPYPLLVLFVDLSWAEDSYLFSDLITTVFFLTPTSSFHRYAIFSLPPLVLTIESKIDS